MNADKVIRTLQNRHRRYFDAGSPISFAVRPASGPSQVIGPASPEFTITVLDKRGMAALASLDQLRVANAYLDGSLDLDGDLMAALSVRTFFRDFHPVAWLGRYAPTLLRGRVEHDRRAISDHYDRDPAFFTTFMDRRHRSYTQGAFADDAEPLEDAMTRKMERALAAIGVESGDHVLDVGGGWGAFMQYAAERGIRVTTLTLSAESESYMRELAAERGLPVTVVRRHLLAFTSAQRFDAIVNMGVTEHLPDYRATLRKYTELLRPGGRIYLDALAMRGRQRISAFMTRHVYPGRSTPLLLHRYLAGVARSPFLLEHIHDERHNYYLTCRAWAQRLDAAREEIVRQWGERLYRTFRLFLWGSAASFATRQVQAYRWVLHLPEETGYAGRPARVTTAERIA